MADRKGDASKKSPECMKDGLTCPNLKEISANNDMDKETYHCDVCGEHYHLYYDDMR
jgi:hypothetical protein